MEKFTELINLKLKEYVSKIANDQLRTIINYALFPGGKRLRPLLLLCLLDDLNIDLSLGINQAAAIELIHNYSLIHDDLPAMDNDDYRRGRLTVHKKFGEANAILAGDAPLTDAFLLFSTSDIEDSKKLEIIKLAANNSGSNGMVMGQVLDIASIGSNYSLEDVKKIHYHKTRDLIHLAIKSGGIIANLSHDKLNQLDELANYFGLAFQIKDDLDDLIEEGSDLDNEKVTYPSVIGKDISLKLLDEYKTKSLDICSNILGDKLFYKLIERIL